MSFFKDLLMGERKSPAHADLKSETHQVVEAAADSGEGAEDAEAGEDAAATEPSGGAEGETAAEAADADATSAAQSDGEEMDSAITVAPSTIGSRFTTTSMVMTSSTRPDESTKKRRHVSKVDAANSFVYGRADEPWTKPSGRPSVDVPAGVRFNRAQNMRRSCIMRRVKVDEEERNRVEEQDVAWTDNEILDPIVARTVPRAVYGGPKLAIRETKSSKFRYLFSRKPAGVKVYFKQADDERKRPPFVVASVHH